MKKAGIRPSATEEVEPILTDDIEPEAPPPFEYHDQEEMTQDTMLSQV